MAGNPKSWASAIPCYRGCSLGALSYCTQYFREKSPSILFSARRAHAEAKKIKEELISRAESLQNSSEWGPTTLKYRDLMAEWKKSPRASRKDDDALWARFRGAQDVFFKARDAANAKIDREYEANLEV